MMYRTVSLAQTRSQELVRCFGQARLRWTRSGQCLFSVRVRSGWYCLYCVTARELQILRTVSEGGKWLAGSGGAWLSRLTLSTTLQTFKGEANKAEWFHYCGGVKFPPHVSVCVSHGKLDVPGMFSRSVIGQRRPFGFCKWSIREASQNCVRAACLIGSSTKIATSLQTQQNFTTWEWWWASAVVSDEVNDSRRLPSPPQRWTEPQHHFSVVFFFLITLSSSGANPVCFFPQIESQWPVDVGGTPTHQPTTSNSVVTPLSAPPLRLAHRSTKLINSLSQCSSEVRPTASCNWPANTRQGWPLVPPSTETSTCCVNYHQLPDQQSLSNSASDDFYFQTPKINPVG